MGVIYEIPLRCDMMYMRRTGRCINDRTRDQSCFLQASPAGHIAVHYNRGECGPCLVVVVVEEYRKNAFGTNKRERPAPVSLSEKRVCYLAG